MSTLLITGSSGFIGKYFINKYKNNYNIQTFSFLNDSIDNLEFMETDVVIHLSALVHHMGGASEEEYEKVNVTQTLELAKKAKKGSVKHFIFMSSVKVYGEETDSIYKEETLCSPKDDYGKSKLKAENELLKLESKGFRISIVRTPIVYGYGVKANIENLVSLVEKVPVLPFSNIHNNRSMVYIGNLCNLLNKIIETGSRGIFLASDDKPLSTTKLIKLIATELDKKRWLISIPLFPLLLKLLKPSFYMRLYKSLEVDNTQTLKELDYTNSYSTADGIKYMIHGEDS